MRGRKSQFTGVAEKAVKEAIRFLAYRPRSEAEVRARLKHLEFTDDVTAQTLKRLCRLNYLNDEMFARNWARARAENRGYGPRRIERELKAKGILPLLVTEAVREAFAGEDEEEQAKTVMERKFKGKDLTNPKCLRRAVALLQRRGYSSRVIFNLLGQAVEDD